MLISLHDLVRKYSVKIRGVVHCGAHQGQEYSDYARYTPRMVFIEMDDGNYKILSEKLAGKPEVKLYNVALAATERREAVDMWVSPQNAGQSTSLLEPDKHLQKHPDITFEKVSKEIHFNKLDNIAFDRLRHNFLNIDVQGYELEVLKGAAGWTLDHIDYIYCEVNRDSTYKGCPHIDQLDAFLSKWNFERKETSWGGDIWGDAFYVKKKAMPAYRHQNGTNVSNFQQEATIHYPEDNKPYFEKWYLQNRSPVEGWEYLPVLWTSYYVNNNRRGRIEGLPQLQQYLNSLDRSKKYYTVVQYDDGILSNVSHLNLRVYAMSGNRIDYPLPLICQPHPYKFNFERNILVNFIGGETHPIRKEIMKLKGKEGCYISSNKHTLESFCHILSTSVFTLCPRGYGQTSFRICEAMQYGSIPVYISDRHIMPHSIPFGNYGLAFNHLRDDYGSIIDALHKFIEYGVEKLQESVNAYYQQYFTFEANKKLIEEDLKKHV